VIFKYKSVSSNEIFHLISELFSKNIANLHQNKITMKFHIGQFTFVTLIALSQCEVIFRNVASDLKVLPDGTNFASRIVNGQAASAYQFPHQALIYINTLQGTFQCGGSLISSTWVLSAAHCIIG
jgi:Trypsin